MTDAPPMACIHTLVRDDYDRPQTVLVDVVLGKYKPATAWAHWSEAADPPPLPGTYWVTDWQGEELEVHHGSVVA